MNIGGATEEIQGETDHINKDLVFIYEMKEILLQRRHRKTHGGEIEIDMEKETVESCDERLNEAIANNEVGNFVADGELLLGQLKHLVAWMTINTSYLHMFLQIAIVGSSGEIAKWGRVITEDDNEIVCLDGLNSDAIESMRLETGHAFENRWLQISGTNMQQMKIPVITVVAMESPGDVLIVQGYKLTKFEDVSNRKTGG